MKKILSLISLCFLFISEPIQCNFDTESSSLESNSNKTNDKEDIFFINSDETLFKKEHVICNGNVIVVYSGRIISANKILYDKITKSIKAEGCVIIKDEKQNVYFFDSIIIEKNFLSGEAKNIKIIMSDKSRLAADSCKIKNGKFELANAIYSPCYECTISGELTWQVKASHVIFDPENETIYKNARLETFGLPILYTPYLSQPSPKLKRKSGFLPAKFSNSTLSGFSFLPKYFISISKSQELILKPIITSKIGSAAWAYYGYRFKNGEFNIDASLTGMSSVKNYTPTNEKEAEAVKKIQKSGYRGHIFSKLRYEINDIWRCGFDINLTSDRYYLKRFPFFKSIHNASDRTLESSIKLEGFSGRNYTSIKASMFQSEHTDHPPKILPVIEKNFSDSLLSGTLNIDTILMNLAFNESRSAQKALSNISWQKKIMLQYGSIMDFRSAFALEALQMSKKLQQDKNDRKSNIRANPQISLSWKWPLLVTTKISNAIFTPIVGLILSGNKKYFDIFEDPFREINDINFLDSSRSMSSYNIDPGSRICYGTKISAYRKDGKNLVYFTLGRSTELTTIAAEQLDVSGLKYKNSNIVTSADVFLHDNLTFISNGSYSTKTKRWTKFESGLKLTRKRFDFDVLLFNGKQCFFNPFSVDATFTESKKIQKYKGVMFDAGWQASNKIKIKTSLVFGDEKSKLIKRNLGIIYSNECAYIEAMLERTNYKGGDLRPENAIRLTVRLKNIGI